MNVSSVKTRQVALQTMVELCKDPLVAVKFLKLKIMSNLLTYTYIRDLDCRKDINRLLEMCTQSPTIITFTKSEDFEIERERLQKLLISQKKLSGQTKKLLEQLLQ